MLGPHGLDYNTIHNFIQKFDFSEGKLLADNISFEYGGSNEDAKVSGGNNDMTNSRSDKIPEDMWRDY